MTRIAGFRSVFAFTMLQELVSRSLNAGLGRYIHMVGSLHLYDRDRDEVAAYLSEGQSTLDPMPQMPVGDPWGKVNQLLSAEAQIRALIPFERIALPEAGYWADFARLWHSGQKLVQPETSATIKSQITLHSFEDFF